MVIYDNIRHNEFINLVVGSDGTLKKLRIKMGISQKQLAKMVGVTQVYISRIEKGDIGGLTFRNILKLSKIFKMDPVELFELLLNQHEKYKRR